MPNVIRLSDENYKKYDAVRKIGLEVIRDERGLTIQDKLNPHADSCIDTRFSHINEILMMFKLDLGKANIVVIA